MKLLVRLNLYLGAAFLVSGTIAGVASWQMVMRGAREGLTAEAQLMMNSALASGAYTESEVAPLLSERLKMNFPPQSIPFYAVSAQLNRLREKYPAYSFRQVALNPTNPSDRPQDWESDLIQHFRNQPDQGEIVGERETPLGAVLFLAQPIRIGDPGCLTCHSTTSAAPAAMLARYGKEHGFGWKLNETVGSVIVSVPAETAYARASRTLWAVLLSCAAVFALLFGVANLVLIRAVIQPLARIAEVTDRVSAGDLDAPALAGAQSDEMQHLEVSINRLRTSLRKAMSMLER